MFLALPVKEILSRSRHLTLTRGHAFIAPAEHGGNECETRKTNILNCHTAIHAMHTRHRKDGPATAPILSTHPTCNRLARPTVLSSRCARSRRRGVRASTVEVCHAGVLAEGARRDAQLRLDGRALPERRRTTGGNRGCGE